MTPFWLSVAAGCAVSAVCGFVLMRYGVPRLPKFKAAEHGVASVWSETTDATALSEPVSAAPAVVRQPRPEPPVALPPRIPARAPTVKRHAAAPRTAAAAARRAAAERMPAPTVPEPSPVKLILWARQVEAGERTMSVATDGCRVTWDRTCRHGHPTWLVRLGYLEHPRAPLQRHTPR